MTAFGLRCLQWKQDTSAANFSHDRNRILIRIEFRLAQTRRRINSAAD